MQPPIVLALVLLAQAASQPPSPATAGSECAIAAEAAYAFTREQPVQVGGGAMYVAAREQRYLNVLRGPTGQPITYRRTGSLKGSDDRTILDQYELTYDGLDTPVAIYVDAYHYDDELKAPKGFTCAVSIGLNAPAPDVFLAMSDLIGLAIEQGSQREFQPISIDADGSGTHGVVFDQFRYIARMARHAAVSGHPMDPEARTPEVVRARTVVVAFPLRCDGRSVAPANVELVAGPQTAPPRREGELVTSDALGRLLPGTSVAAGTIASVYQLERPRPNDSVRIAYADGACGTSNEVTFPFHVTGAKPLRTPPPALPADQTPTERPVRLQALIDFEGVARRIVYVGGPAALTQAAIDGVRSWTAEPARINGAPVITPVALQVKFERR